MKKFVSKFLPIAVVVLAMILSTFAVSAAELTREVKYEDSKVIVRGAKVADATNAVVILATRQNGTQAKDTLENATANIVYVDQAPATNINFSFIPKTDVGGNTISVFMGGAGADTVSVNNIATNNVVLYTDGGAVSDQTYAWESTADGYTYNRIAPKGEVAGEEVVLPTPVKAGFTFAGWYNNEEFTGDAETVISSETVGEIKVYAKYTATATCESATGYCASAEGADDKVGVISVTAKVDAYASATRYGFLVYRANKEGGTVEIEASNGTLDANGFYTVVFGIPSDKLNEDIVIIPFIADESDKVTYGAAERYSVGESNTNYLGTVEQLKEAFGIEESTN